MPRWKIPAPLALTAAAGLGLALPPAAASAMQTVQLTLKNHRFTPDRIQVPTGERFQIELSNQDDTTDELESTDMKFEKIVVPGGKIRVFAGPLHPGTYQFYDEYHQETATGRVTASDAAPAAGKS